MNRAAIYAGTFDPITVGHMDVVERAARIFPKLVLAVAGSTSKQTWFSVEDRVAIAREALASFKNIEVEAFEGLLVAYARRRRIGVVVRGLRAFSDFEFEFQMALTNRKMAPDIETIFLMPKEDYSYISSHTVREIAELGGEVKPFVPPASLAALRRRLAEDRRSRPG